MDRFGDKICCNPTVKLKKQESYPVIDIDKITPGYKAVRSVASIEYTGQGGAKFQDHDVLFARITPCLENGKMAIADTEGQNGIGSTELFVFRGIDGVSDTDYVYYLLCMKHIRQLAANSMTGASGRQRADLDFIKRIQWDFPDIEMQKKIASVLSAYDNLIEVNNKRIKVLEQIAENLYKEWFVRFRFPGHEKADFENGIPKGWRRGRISEFYTTSSGGTPSRELDEYYVDGTIPWIKTGELQDCLLIDTEERITEVAVKKSSAKFFPKDSVLMAMYGVNIARPTEEKILKEFEYIHYNSARYCSIYAIGYTDDFTKAEDRTYRKVDAMMQQDWYFSMKAFTEFKEKLQNRIHWDYSGETEILILQNNPGKRNILNFQNYVAIDVNKGIREGYIDSFQSFMESLIRSSKRRVTAKEAIRDVRNARISIKDIIAGAIDDCKKVPTPIKEIAKDRLFYRCANTML